MSEKRLFYVPLESYKSRYTEQWCAPKTGWLERNWRKYKVNYVRIDDILSEGNPIEIKHGVVLDAVGRANHAFSQTKSILGMIDQKHFTPDDVIYFDDFWHPGLDAIAYALSLVYGYEKRKWPKMYAFLHAQSVDVYDFTYPMKDWINLIERAYSKIYSGIFVCCPTLAELVAEGISPLISDAAITITGHPFSSDEVMSRMPLWYSTPRTRGFELPKRSNKVVWSSRWDAEKRPGFFMEVMEKVIKEVPDVEFHICTGNKIMRSNIPEDKHGSLKKLEEMFYTYPNNIFIHTNLNKEQYYEHLCQAKIQFNCALQDWVAISLLEASVAGCYPVYPHFRSFPETFDNHVEFMYANDVPHAAKMVVDVLLDQTNLWSQEAITAREWIHTRYDTSWQRMTNAMGLTEFTLPRLYRNV